MDQRNNRIIYRSDKYGELPQISALMEAVFQDCIAPGYDPQGIDEFLQYIHPTAIAYRLKRNHFLRVAEVEGNIVGVLEMRTYHHLSLLFVDRKFQRQGIAKRLVQEAIAICHAENPQLQNITVHANPGAIPAYKAMQFQIVGEERVENGIRYVPMRHELEQKNQSH
ncbi:GNAT family N-acetyltransferase [[Limnothrix rosea] IAM M-220]|uniref:GNAT family N-acetyltransferase n=1 Tax=[Limnothrix rosea] IAM M-220 TaxID=454133 RepID=UPI0009672C43|nr:GNAT family N-acetyltransferase [[Limnothrix rosea] IAM M-220]OKH18057.1 hypothetical protein NIES208_06855 [[Limnothrix rosea] IAM M-220]